MTISQFDISCLSGTAIVFFSFRIFSSVIYSRRVCSHLSSELFLIFFLKMKEIPFCIVFIGVSPEEKHFCRKGWMDILEFWQLMMGVHCL